MWVPLHTDKKQPDEIGTLIILPCRWGSWGQRSCWGLYCLCHPMEASALGSHLVPGASFTKSLSCSEPAAEWWGIRYEHGHLRGAQRRSCSRLSPCILCILVCMLVICLIRMSHVTVFIWVCLEEEDEALLPQWGFLRDVQVLKTLVVRYMIDGLKH